MARRTQTRAPRPAALSRAQVRDIDRIAIEEYGIPGMLLMENAARACARHALALLSRAPRARAVIVCGGGNNGGDGYAIARHLHNAGVTIEICSIVARSTLGGDAALNRAIVDAMKLPVRELRDGAQLRRAAGRWHRAGLLIDAMLGTGFHGALRPHVADAIGAFNAAARRGPVKVLAVDLPSGLDCDTGLPSEPTVCASMTVTFVAPKTGFKHRAAKKFIGTLAVADIGAPPEIVARVRRDK